MSNNAPVAEPVVNSKGIARPAWQEYFADSERGDVGTTWNPTITNLTSSGTPTITGVYYQNNGFADFFVKIVPGVNTSSTFTTTYIDLPFAPTADTPCAAIFGSNIAFGIVNAAAKRIFPPTWTNVTTPVTISGRVKVL